MNTRKSKTQAPSLNIGASLLLVIFLVLCIATFAALSLSTAKSDANASEQLAERRTLYYTATNQAEHLVQMVDQILQEEYASSQNWQASAVSRIQKTGQEMDSVTLTAAVQDELPLISWQLPLTEGQALAVELTLQEPEEDGQLYRITRWQTVNIAAWEGDDTLDLMPFDN